MPENTARSAPAQYRGKEQMKLNIPGEIELPTGEIVQAYLTGTMIGVAVWDDDNRDAANCYAFRTNAEVRDWIALAGWRR